MSSNTKLLLLGLDGLELDYLKKYSELDLGSFTYGELKSTVPPMTVPAWISLATGKSPGNLGIVDFFRITKDYQRERPGLMENFAKSHFFHLSGKKIGMNRFYKLTPRLKELSENIEVYEEYLERPWDKITGRGAIEADIKNMRRNRETLKDLMDEDYDLIFYFLNLPDFGIHFGSEEDMKEIYEEVGKFLEEMSRKCREKDWSLMVVSDHGARKVKRRFNINTWLKENDYLKLKKTLGLKMKIIDWLSEKNIGFVRTLMGIKNKLDEHFSGEKDRIKDKMILSNINWKSTRVFAVSTAVTNYMPLYINLESKYEKGCVKGKNYEKLRKELKEKLLSIKDSNGEKVMDDVQFKEEIYEGNNMEDMPDLVIKSKSDYLIGHRPFSNIFSNRNRYIHGLNGTILGKGPVFKENFIIKGAEIVDIAPTILHMLGCSISKDTDGKVLKDMFRSKSDPAKRKVKISQELKNKIEKSKLSEKNEKKISKRLKDLGYIE